MRMLIALLLLFGVSACESGITTPGEFDRAITPDGLVLTTDRNSYSPGDQVVLTLRNETGGSLGFNLCSSILERFQGGQWIAVERLPDTACPLALEILPPGQSASFTFTLSPTLPAGEYRYRTNLERIPTGERGFHISNTFTVA